MKPMQALLMTDKLVNTCVRVTKEQKHFLENSTYNQSKIFRKAISELMHGEKIPV